MRVLTVDDLSRIIDGLQADYTAEDNKSAAEFCRRLKCGLSTLTSDHVAPPQPADETNDKTFPMPFGKYRGTPIDQVPRDYWTWLLGQKDPIKHPAVARWVRTHIQSATPTP